MNPTLTIAIDPESAVVLAKGFLLAAGAVAAAVLGVAGLLAGRAGRRAPEGAPADGVGAVTAGRDEAGIWIRAEYPGRVFTLWLRDDAAFSLSGRLFSLWTERRLAQDAAANPAGGGSAPAAH